MSSQHYYIPPANRRAATSATYTYHPVPRPSMVYSVPMVPVVSVVPMIPVVPVVPVVPMVPVVPVVPVVQAVPVITLYPVRPVHAASAHGRNPNSMGPSGLYVSGQHCTSGRHCYTPGTGTTRHHGTSRGRAAARERSQSVGEEFRRSVKNCIYEIKSVGSGSADRARHYRRGPDFESPARSYASHSTNRSKYNERLAICDRTSRTDRRQYTDDEPAPRGRGDDGPAFSDSSDSYVTPRARSRDQGYHSRQRSHSRPSHHEQSSRTRRRASPDSHDGDSDRLTSISRSDPRARRPGHRRNGNGARSVSSCSSSISRFSNELGRRKKSHVQRTPERHDFAVEKWMDTNTRRAELRDAYRHVERPTRNKRREESVDKQKIVDSKKKKKDTGRRRK